MSRYHFSDQARADLDEIWLFIAEDNLAAADRLIDEIIARFGVLVEHPGMGHACEELAPSLRSSVVGNYLIFYRPRRNGIDVVRVLSGFRDLPALFDID